jgi:Rps23 Pro-64 3,4-dihydroxylase Tpa1-like proline 4-hydroxylase
MLVALVGIVSVASPTVAKRALNHDEPCLSVDGVEAPFLFNYGQESDIDIVGDIREIPDFFPPAFLEKAHADLLSFTAGQGQDPVPQHWLYTTPAGTKKLRSNDDIAERSRAVHAAMKKAEAEERKPPGVVYSKWELGASRESQKLHERFWLEMESAEARNKLTATLGQPMANVTHSFVSMFNMGDFLSTHAASRWEGRGEWAYILYLSKDWQPEYGGNLYFLNSTVGEEDVVAHVSVPEYNKMVLFKLKPHCPLHFVSQVRVHKARMALTGWYSTQEQSDRLRATGLLNTAPTFLIPLNETSAYSTKKVLQV